MKVYRAEKFGSLLVVKACLEGTESKTYPKLLLDTGSTYTIISYEILESIGCSPVIPTRRQRIVTGIGYEIVPVVLVNKFHCLGKSIVNKEILAHTLPFGTYVDGLLGMDFLSIFKIEIRPYSREIILD
ncbi:MAG TPA: retropepsin-like aspartic protease [Thermodesulfobacteriota bacterium]|nr:retropepsin-like aspartic protease [Thermodesulfobacteriota bacterium]